MNIAAALEKPASSAPLRPSLVAASSLILSSAFPVIALSLFLVPTEYRPASFKLGEALLLSLPLACGQLALYTAALLARSRRSFFIAAALLFALSILASLLLTALVHEEFAKALFALLAGALVLSLSRSDLLDPRGARLLRAMKAASLACVAAFMVWVFELAFEAIVLRHPERAKFILMNAYSLAACAIITILAFRAKMRYARRVRISRNAFVVDELDFSGFFSAIDLELINRILARGGSATCADVASGLSERAGASDGARKWDCEECKKEGFTATSCPKYKNLYNRVLSIRKIFESLKIGTVLAPTNKLRIRDEGWRIKLAKDVEAKLE